MIIYLKLLKDLLELLVGLLEVILAVELEGVLLSSGGTSGNEAASGMLTLRPFLALLSSRAAATSAPVATAVSESLTLAETSTTSTRVSMESDGSSAHASAAPKTHQVKFSFDRKL